jgi:hypothetical protein
MKKIYTQHRLIAYAAALVFAVSACKKSSSPTAPPATVSFSMKDTLIVPSAYASTDPAIYNKYNGNTYSVNSKNQTMIIARKKSGTDHDFMLFFQDTSVYALPPYFEVIIKNADVHSFLPEYDLTDASRIQLNYHQRFKDLSTAINMNGKVISGTLKITYDKPYNTISGEITNLRVPIDFYTPMDVREASPTRSNMLLLEGGSYRTVSLTFTYAEIGSAP